MENPQLVTESMEHSLLKKWGTVLDAHKKNSKIAPLTTKNARIGMAMLLENQERWCFGNNRSLLSEANVSTGAPSAGGAFGNVGPTGMSNSDSYATGDARLPKILIPMIRRTFPELITNEIVGVQPMSGPVGLAFAMRFKYQGAGLDTATGYQIGGGNLPNDGRTGTTNGSELGYQRLDTRFTGMTSGALSGAGTGAALSADFATISSFVDVDTGVAALLSQFEVASNIPQVEVTFEKTAVQAGTRRLSAKWSIELEQDLKNMNNINIDEELVNTMSYEVQSEIDREMVMRMIQASIKGGLTKGFSVWKPQTASGRWLGEISRDFYQKLIIEANRIAVRNRRGAANFIIATPRVCAILESLTEFQFMPVNGSVNTAPTGVAKVGQLGGRYTVYRDTRTEAQNPALGGSRTEALEYALLGYKGPEYWDTGIIYCPYIPLMVQRTIHPTTFSPNVGLLTRYGVVDNLFGSDLYYHLVVLTGLGTPFTPNTTQVYF